MNPPLETGADAAAFLAGDAAFMASAIALGDDARGTTAPNPNVGGIVVANGAIVGRGATQPGGRPHAEAVALAQAGAMAAGATLYTSLEPCAHVSPRGPACADLIVAAGVARACVALQDPDPRTAGQGIARMREAGIQVEIGQGASDATRSMAGFLTRLAIGRPFVTLKLAISIDGRIAMADGASRYITGPEARAHGHLQRARSDAILVGRGTFDADDPRLDVRLPGLEVRAPRRFLLTTRDAPLGWTALAAPADVARLHDVNDLLVEGGAATAAAFLRADLVDRLLIYTAPIILGAGAAAIGEIGLASLAEAHGRWVRTESAILGSDRLDVYERTSCSQA